MSGRKKYTLCSMFSCRLSLIVLFACYVLGALFGCLLAGHVLDGEMLRYYIERYAAATDRGAVSFHFFPVLIDTIRIPILVVLLGFSFVGAFGIPILYAVQGILLCFSASVFTGVAGLPGMAAAFLLFGTSALIWTPAFFALGEQSMQLSCRIMQQAAGDHRGSRHSVQPLLLDFCICFALLFASALVEFWLTPVVLPLLGRLL